MTDPYVIEGVKVWLGWDNPTPNQENIITYAVNRAENTIRQIRQQESSEAIEDCYLDLAVEMACYQIEKRGVDGVTSFAENGISRVYEKGSYPPSMLRRITPKARGIRKKV